MAPKSFSNIFLFNMIDVCIYVVHKQRDKNKNRAHTPPEMHAVLVILQKHSEIWIKKSRVYFGHAIDASTWI